MFEIWIYAQCLSVRNQSVLVFFNFDYITDFMKLFTIMAEDWKIQEKDKRDEMLKSQRLSRIVVKIAVTAAVVPAVFYVVARLNNVSFAPSSENLFNTNVSRVPFISSKFFFDTETSPAFEITWLCQAFVCLSFDLTMNVYDGLFITIVLHLCTQLKILRMDIENLTLLYKKLSFANVLKSIVERHLELNRYLLYSYYFRIISYFELI